MTDEIENLILEHLRVLRANDEVFRQEFAELKVHMLAIENHIAASALTEARHSGRIDQHDDRLARIERRLDLI